MAVDNQRRTFVVTGAAGFLGSALTIDLARQHDVIAIDRRSPGKTLRDAASEVLWHRVDIADEAALAQLMTSERKRFGRIDFVIHLAAYYHFGLDWRSEYEHTNVRGTASVQQAAMAADAGRLIFASSVAAMLPGQSGEVLNEQSPPADYIPYGKSKALGEEMVRDASNHLPAIILRIGGVFSDWCELPPLYSLIKLWGGRFPLNRTIVGRGQTGIPYLHRTDFVRLVRACADRDDQLNSCEVLLASQQGTVTHQSLFSLVHDTLGHRRIKPIFVSPTAARIGLGVQRAVGHLTRNMPVEHPWMLDFIDRPWTVDTSYTQQRLDWTCGEGMGICDRLPVILQRFKRDPRDWERRNRRRNQQMYDYSPD